MGHHHGEDLQEPRRAVTSACHAAHYARVRGRSAYKGAPALQKPQPRLRGI
jgi:hypothetical protein